MRNIVNIDYSDTGCCGSSSFAYDCNELYLIIKPGENQKTGIQIEATNTSGQVYTEAIEPVGGLIQVQVPETLWNTAGTMKIRLLSNEGNTEYTQFVCVDVNSMDVCCKYSGGTFRFYLYGENIQYYAGSDTDGGHANSVKNGADSYLQFNTGVENTSDTWLLVQREQFIEHRSADNLPYIPRGGIYTSDLDTCYTTGIYLYTPDTNGRPDEYGHVFVTVSDGDTYNGTSNWIRQIAYGANGEIFSRQKTNEEAWTEWIQIFNLSNYKQLIQNDLLVKEVELTATATSVTIDGLDLLRDKQYEFEVIGGQSAYSDWWVRFNGDSSAKYYTAGRYDSGDNNGSNVELSKNSGYRPASQGFYYALGLGPIGIVRGKITYVKSNKTAVMEWETRDVGNKKQLIASAIGLYDEDISSKNLTSVTFTIKTSGTTFSVGTIFRIRRIL